MEFKNVLARFADVTEEADGGYLAVCPAHADSRPSLRIWRGDDNKVRLTCRAGCQTDAVRIAARLNWTDLFDATGDGQTVPKEKPALVGSTLVTQLAMYVDATSLQLGDFANPAANVAREYAEERFGLSLHEMTECLLGFDDGRVRGLEFTDSHGRPRNYRSGSFRAFPRLTVPLNDFRGVTRGLQGRDLSGKCPGRWLSLSNPEGQRWAQYGVFRGQGGYGVTIVSEGPGDGLTAVAVGYDAVCIRGAALAGSPDLLAELAEGLKGTQVIAAGDNDAAGQRFNRALADGLKPFGIEVYALPVPNLGPKTDLTDWRYADKPAFPAQLHAAIKAARPVVDRAVAEAQHRKAVVAERTGAVTVSDDQGRDAANILADLVVTYGESDAMNAHALVAWSDGRIKYAPGLGFHVWNGIVWERSEQKVRQEIHRMGAALVLSGNAKEARGFTMTTRIDALMTELRSVPSVYVKADAFDARPNLLSFRNGVVDLRTGELRGHDKHDMLTVSLPLDYDPSALCPRWDQFLTEIFPGNPDLVGYMQRLTGYGITGNTSEQCFAVLHGKGANGKSVLTDVLTTVFGEITKTTPFATFEDKGSGGIPNDIAALRGARLVMASEGEAGKPMSEAVLKRVTGKDKVTARFLRQEFFTFAPTFLILLATNHKPRFRGADEGLWRRVKLIPFTRYFAPHERDYDLDRKLLAESAGIVAWAVRGAVEWYRSGLGDPESITSATKEYRATSDALAGFYSDDPDMPAVLVKSEGNVMLGGDAFNAYLDWCEAENLPGKERWTRRTFFAAMEERGISRKRVAKGNALVGVRLADEPEKPIEGTGIFATDSPAIQKYNLEMEAIKAAHADAFQQIIGQ
ncbi:phage/plasmid primase, P4 family [Streptomyces virginiae]|uniref:phage/plasmid primase, P4 family n=1 Tax=Streptomyces virginiae TaxID=1961 RepID=UPI003688B033